MSVVQQELWVELQLRFLARPRQTTRNRLYKRILTRFDDDPDRVKFPISRNR